MRLNIVDAFTTKVFGGNPAGVVLIPEGGDFPDDNVMVSTAAELRYSETAFIKRLDKDKFNIRYFTPAAEVDLCGHATIGSFFVLLNEGIISPGKTYIDETLAGTLEIDVTDDAIMMDMADPNVSQPMTGEERKGLYKIMGISEDGQDHYDGKIKLMPRIAYSGLSDIMMPVKDEEELSKINPDFPALSELSKKMGVTGVHAFTVNSKDDFIHARNFAPLYDIDEEAATGTSNGALTYYLYDYGIVREGEMNTVIQGEKMNRPSRIVTRLTVEDGNVKIKVGGFAVSLATGEINI